LDSDATFAEIGFTGNLEGQPGGVEGELVAVAGEKPIDRQGELVATVVGLRGIGVDKGSPGGDFKRRGHRRPPFVEEGARLDKAATEARAGEVHPIFDIFPMVLVQQREAADLERQLLQLLVDGVLPGLAVLEAVELTAALILHAVRVRGSGIMGDLPSTARGCSRRA